MAKSRNDWKPNGQGNPRNGWNTDQRWKGILRLYSMEDVLRLRGSVQIEHTLARLGAERLWRSEEHTSELQSRLHLVCRLLLEKKKEKNGKRCRCGVVHQEICSGCE